MSTHAKKSKRNGQTVNGRVAGAAAPALAARRSAKPSTRGTVRSRVMALPEIVNVKHAPDPDVLGRLRKLVDTFGHNQTAALLTVDRSQLSRCLKGTEKVSVDLARRVLDLDYVIARAIQIMHDDEVGPWLLAPEPLLGGAVPLNVLRLSGSSRVIGALDGIRAGAFA
jgi:hypothetical protein